MQCPRSRSSTRGKPSFLESIIQQGDPICDSDKCVGTIGALISAGKERHVVLTAGHVPAQSERMRLPLPGGEGYVELCRLHPATVSEEELLYYSESDEVVSWHQEVGLLELEEKKSEGFFESSDPRLDIWAPLPINDDRQASDLELPGPAELSHTTSRIAPFHNELMNGPIGVFKQGIATGLAYGHSTEIEPLGVGGYPRDPESELSFFW